VQKSLSISYASSAAVVLQQKLWRWGTSDLMKQDAQMMREISVAEKRNGFEEPP